MTTDQTTTPGDNPTHTAQALTQVDWGSTPAPIVTQVLGTLGQKTIREEEVSEYQWIMPYIDWQRVGETERDHILTLLSPPY